MLSLTTVILCSSPTMTILLSLYMHTANARSIVYDGGPVVTFYDNVTCVGTESRLVDCQHQYASTTGRVCAGYAGVLCQSECYLFSTLI